MANQYKNKIIFGQEVLIDLTSDTVDEDHLLLGYTAHDKSGAPIVGSCTYDSNTADATATAADILANKTAYIAGEKITGTIQNNSALSGTISDINTPYVIPQGYYDGTSSVSIDSDQQSKIIASNIREGVEILGVVGTMTGTEDVNAQQKTIIPTFTQQTIVPDSPTYNYLSSVTVSAIPITMTDNAAGGVTVTVGTII